MRIAAEVDIAVIGSGVAGASLVSHLAASPMRDRRVLLIDRVPDPLSGRSWSFWAARPRLVDRAVSHTWTAATVHQAHRAHRVALDPYRFHFVRGEDLLGLHRRLLTQAPWFETATTTVRRVSPGTRSSPALVHTDHGDVTARWVFDSRRTADHLRSDQVGGMHMVFRGFEVRTADPLPERDSVTFVDFRVPQGDTVRFAYLLPLAHRHAVVDLVELVPSAPTEAPPSTGTPTAQLEGYLREVQGLHDWSVVRSEHGSLPLQAPAGPRRMGGTGRVGRVMTVGRAGGLLRASTGFAFDRIQRDSMAITSSLVRWGHPGTGWRPPRRHAWLDRVFLEVAADEPDAVRQAMSRMFRAPSAAVPLSFLDGETSLLQEAALIEHLPYRAFLRAALSPRTYARIR